MVTNWDVRKAAKKLNIELISFAKTGLDPNDVRGASLGRQLAIRPGEPHPVFITFHEMAHIVLGHTTPGAQWLLHTPSGGYINTEVDAHWVALALAKRLHLVDGVDFNKDFELEYLFHAGHGHTWVIQRYIAENRSRLMEAVDKIYEAGLVKELVAA